MKPRSFLWIYTLLLLLCGLFVVNVPSVYAEEGEVVVKEVFVVRGASAEVSAAKTAAQTCEISAELRWHHNKKVKVVYYWRECTGNHTVRWELDSVQQAQGNFVINSAAGEQSVYKEVLSALQPGDRILLRTWINDVRKADVVTQYQDSEPVWPQIHTRSSADQACFMFSGHVDPWGIFTSGSERYVFHLNTLDWETPWLQSPNQPKVDWHVQFYEDAGLSKLRSEYWFNGVENPCFVELACETISLSIANGSEIPAAGADVQVTVNGKNASQYRIVDDKGNVVAGPSASNVLTTHAMPKVVYQAQVSNDGEKWTDQGCKFQYSEPPVCEGVTLSIANGTEIPAEGADVQVTVNGKNASQYRIVDDKGNVVAGPSANNVFTFHAMPILHYQAQVANETDSWTDSGCEFGYPVRETTPECENIGLNIPNGADILDTGETVQVTIKGKNGTQYRIVKNKTDIVVAGPSTDNVLSFTAMPNVEYQAQVYNDSAGWSTVGCTFQYGVKPPVCENVGLSIPIGTEIPAAGADVQVTVNGKNATQYRIVDDKGNVVAGPSANNVFSFHAVPEVVYQAQVSNDGVNWTDQGCKFQYRAPISCDGVDLSIASGTEIPAEGADVQVTVNGKNASQYRIVDDKGNVVAGPSASNVLTIHAMPNVRYQAQVSNNGEKWTDQGCTFEYPPPLVCDGVTLSIANGTEIPAEGANVDVTVNGKNASHYRIVEIQNGGGVVEVASGTNSVFTIHAMPGVTYQAQVSKDGVNWTNQGCTFGYIAIKDGKCQSVGLSIPTSEKIAPTGADVTVTVNHENGVQYRIIEVESKTVVAGPSTNPVLTFHARPEVEYQAQVSHELGATPPWSNDGCTFKYRTELGRPAFCRDVALSVPNGSDIPATGADVHVTVSGQDATKYQIVTGNKVMAGPSASPELEMHAMPGVVYQAQVANESFGWQSEPVCQFQYGIVAQAELLCELRASHTGDPIGHSEIRAWIKDSTISVPITGIKINWNNKGTVNYPTKEQQGPWFTDNSWFKLDATPQVKDVGFGYYKFEAWVTAQGIATPAYCWGDGNAPDHDNVVPDPGPFAKDNPEGKFNRGNTPSRLPTVGRLPFDSGNGSDKIELILWAFEKEGHGMKSRITAIANEGKPLARLGMESVRNFVKFDGLNARQGIVYGFQIGEHGPWSPLFCPKADGNPTTITVFWGAGGQTWLSDGGAYNDCWWLTVAAALNGWVTVDESVATYNALQPIIDWNGHRNLVFSLAQDKVTGLGPRMQDAVIGLKAQDWQGPIVPTTVPADFWQVVEAWRNSK